MIVVDASALLAILLEEDDGLQFMGFLGRARPTVMSSVNYWEALTRAAIIKGAEGHRLVDELMKDLGVACSTSMQARLGAPPPLSNASGVVRRG